MTVVMTPVTAASVSLFMVTIELFELESGRHKGFNTSARREEFSLQSDRVPRRHSSRPTGARRAAAASTQILDASLRKLLVHRAWGSSMLVPIGPTTEARPASEHT